MTRVISSLGAGSGPTIYYNLDITEQGGTRTASQVSYTVTVTAWCENSSSWYHASLYQTVWIGNTSHNFTITTLDGTTAKSSTATLTPTNLTAGSSSCAWSFSASGQLSGSSGVVSPAKTGSVGVSVYATTPSQPQGWSFWDGGVYGTNPITDYYREDIGTTTVQVNWNHCTGANGTVGTELALFTDGDADWTYINLGDVTSYQFSDLGHRKNIKFAIRSSNTIGGTTLWSGWQYSSIYTRNVMSAPSLTSSASVSYETGSFTVNVGAATDNLSTTMTYTLKGINDTTFTVSAGDPAFLKTKWVAARYDKSLASSTTVPQLSDISGLTPNATSLVTDSTGDLVEIAGWGSYDNFISSFTTNLYVSADTSISVTMNSDDTSHFYLTNSAGTNVSVGQVSAYNAASTFTVTLKSGWNSVQVLQYEQTGGESLTLNVGGATIASKVTTMLAERDSSTAAVNSNTIYTNNGTSGIYFTLAQLKTAATNAASSGLDLNDYKDNIDLQLRATNSHGTTKTVTISVPIDLGKDAPVSAAPTVSIASGSTKTISGTAYYFPKYQSINLTLPSSITDALGRKCTIDVLYTSSNVDTLIRNVAAGTTTTAVNDVDLDMTNTSKTASFKARAKTFNGVTHLAKDANGNYPDASASTASNPVHYWAPPTVSTSGITRTSTTGSFSVTVKRNTSLTIASNNTITITTTGWTESGDVGQTTAMHTFTVSDSTLTETDKPSVSFTANDPVGVGLGQSAISASVNIPVFVPAFAIRTNGIGVNAVPDGTANFMVGGTIYTSGAITTNGSIYTGGDVHTNWVYGNAGLDLTLSPDAGHRVVSATDFQINGSNLYMQGATQRAVVRMKNGDSTGDSLSIGADGSTFIGGGESPHNLAADATVNASPSKELLYLTSDNDIQLYVNMQNGVASAINHSFDKYGNFTLSGNTLTVDSGTSINHGIELGSTVGTNYSFLDVHSSAYSNDYDGRLIWYGGSSGVNGGGSATLYASNLLLAIGGYTDINVYPGHGSGNARLWYDATNNALNFWNQTNAYTNIHALNLVPSTRELKTNIVETDDVLHIIKSTKVYDYHYKSDLEEWDVTGVNEHTNQHHWLNSGRTKDPDKVQKRRGLMVDEAPPELVVNDGIDTYAMISMLWKAVQELSGQVESLRDKLNKR